MYPEDRFEFMPVEDEECGTGDFLAGLVLGAAIGAALALLYAPKSGDAMRRDIADASGQVRDRVTAGYAEASSRTSAKASEARDAVRVWVDHAKAAIDDTRQRLDEAVVAGRSAYADKKSELDAQVEASLDA